MTEIASEAVATTPPVVCVDLAGRPFELDRLDEADLCPLQETASRYPGQLANILVDSLEILEKARQALVDSLEILENVLQPLAGNGGSNGPATVVQHADPKVASLPSNKPQRALKTAPALTFLQAHCAEKITLSEVANVCGMSPTQLTKTFRKERGVSFKGFLLSYRLDRSCDFLKQGRSVKWAATSSGFTDESYFSREFKRRYKTTPTKFKETHMMGCSLGA